MPRYELALILRVMERVTFAYAVMILILMVLDIRSMERRICPIAALYLLRSTLNVIQREAV